MKRILLASLLFATPALADDAPRVIPVPTELLDHAAFCFINGCSHREGMDIAAQLRVAFENARQSPKGAKPPE